MLKSVFLSDIILRDPGAVCRWSSIFFACLHFASDLLLLLYSPDCPDVLYSTQTQTRRLATINITCFICIVQFLSHKGLSSCCLTEDWGKNQKEKAKRNIRKLRRHDYCIFLWTSRVCLGVGLIQINARTIIFNFVWFSQLNTDFLPQFKRLG